MSYDNGTRPNYYHSKKLLYKIVWATTCSYCNGTGKEVWEGDGPWDAPIHVECTECNGTGKGARRKIKVKR